MKHILLLTFLLFAVNVKIAAAQFDHREWDNLLSDNVLSLDGGKKTEVDYKGMAEDEEKLDAYLSALAGVSRVQFDTWDKEDQLAFLINAYNSWTVKLILTGYPGLESIKDLGSLFQSPWKKKFIPLLDEQRSLDDIEHNLIRKSGRYNEPRIHFAVNCASIGCPALKNRAYNGANLDAQLEEATRLFLLDRTRNRLEEDRLQVSSIFKWYREDFGKGWKGTNSLKDFLALYHDSLGLNQQQTEAVIAGTITIGFLDYDWRLNDLQ